MNTPALWSFDGRASRSKFWLVFLLSIFVSLVVLLFTLLATPALILMGTFSPVVASVVSILLNVLLIPIWIISIATTVRRFHDRNKSGWWYLIALVPVIGFFWIFIECGFLKGTVGANIFGDEQGSNSGGAPGTVGSISTPSVSETFSTKLIISIIVGVILLALIGRAIWAYQQVKVDEVKAQQGAEQISLQVKADLAKAQQVALQLKADEEKAAAAAVAVPTAKLTVNNIASKFTCGPSTVIGTNSEVYNTVQIGTQCWIKQDVKGGLYTWAQALRLPPGCDTSSCKVTTNQQGVCPSGWHIPTDMEFKTLRMFLGMSELDASQAIFGGIDQGTKLKVGGTSGFDAVTDSGFNAFWTSSEDGVTKAWVLSLFTNETTVGRGTNNKTHPTSVRCLKN